jgi:hypothetical protein
VDDHDDRRLLAVLAAHGSDLSKPAHTIHFLYFNSLPAAQSAAAELSAAGYHVRRVSRAPSTSLWSRLFGPRQYSCVAETHAVPAEAAVFATTQRMNALARRLGGEYDGWEASIEK